MAINNNVSVQHNNGGFLPNIIPLTHSYYHPPGNLFNCHEEVLSLQPVQLGQSFKTVGYGCTSCWGDVGAGDAEVDVTYISFIVSVQHIEY